MVRPQRIVLIGLPGTGKSAVARQVARRLGWHAVDTDDHIVATDGREIAQIFRDEGEAHFRQLERHAVLRLTNGQRWVLATGGGTVLDPENRRRLWQDAFVVYLDARTSTLVGRVGGGDPRRAARRPLLADDPEHRIEALRAARGPLYALADWTVRTDGLAPTEIAEEIAAAWERRSEALLDHPARLESIAGPAPAGLTESEALAARVTTPGGAYPAYAGWDILDRLPGWLRDAGITRTVHIVADAAVADLYGETLISTLRAGGFEAVMHALPLSESRKTLEAAAEIYDRLVAARAERSHAILAFGGGVATDLGGFIAATYLRGMPLVHISTSLLGMVDAAIGGKVAVNHREGKNLIGAFYQPALVVADAALLPTLPRREFISGWGEVIKHGLIMDLELLGWLEAEADALLTLEPEPAVRVLRRSIALKARVVSADEREAGLRMTLNYGHTTAHALEAATGYHSLLHGEAVAVGMVAAAHIGRALGLISAAEEARQNRLIARFGLPLRAPGVDVDTTIAAMSLDKKVSGKSLRWILLDRVGHTTIRDDVPLSLVREAVELVTTTPEPDR